MTIDELIARLEHAKKNGRGWTACCPGHEDAKNSLSINRADDGRILLNCFAGCTAEAIVGALGLTLRDLFPPTERAGSTGRGVTIAELAAAKGLPEVLFRDHGWRDDNGRIVIPYRDDQGRETTRPHIRTAMRAVDGSYWGGPNGGAIDTPYGVWRLEEFRQTGRLAICEGETDTLTLWYHKKPAIGIPGATMLKVLRPEIFRGFSHVLVFRDNDPSDAGDKFARGAAGIATVGGVAKVQIIRPPDGCKDPNDWYRRNPATFEQELRAAIAVAPRFDPSQTEDGTRATATPRPASAPVLVRVADVQPEEVSWIWPGRVARRKVNLLVGDPGLGKSMITLDAAARITRGTAWPDGGLAPLGDVVILTAEDGIADTVRPRLDLHGADVTRVHALYAVRETTGIERTLSLATDIGPLEQAIGDTKAVLVVIDPLSAYLGMANSYRDSDVRRILAPLHALAERTGAAIWGVMHLTKDQQRQALYRGQGSIAFVGAARLVLAVGADPDDENHERRFLMPVKSNLCAPAATLAYRIVSEGARGRLVWEASPVDGVDVNAVLAPQRPEETGVARRDAEAFLRNYLKNGRAPQRDIEQAAKVAGIARRTLYRAKRALGVESILVGFGRNGRWHWRLPSASEVATPAADAPPEVAIYADVATSEGDREKRVDFIESDPEVARPCDVATSGGASAARFPEPGEPGDGPSREAWPTGITERDAVWDQADERFRQGFSGPQATTS
jgi:hypothetical protein